MSGSKPQIVLTAEEERMRFYPYTYICGPMTGYEDYNHPEFNRVAKLLRDKDILVINPAEVDAADPEDLSPQPWDWYLRRDLILIAEKVGRFVMLKGWQNSHGATLERYVGKRLHCDIIYIEDFEDWYNTL